MLLAAQPELVTPVLQVVQRLVTRHLLDRAGQKVLTLRDAMPRENAAGQPQPVRRRAALRRDTIEFRGNPDDLTASAPGERSKDLPTPLDATARAPNPDTSGRRRPRLVLATGH